MVSIDMGNARYHFRETRQSGCEPYPRAHVRLYMII
jgi:hypothetical protein